MDKATIAGIVECLRTSLSEAGVNVSFIALFGSALSGEMHQDSDVDLIIVSPDFDGRDIFERAQLTMAPELAVQKKYKLPLDIISLSPSEYYEAKRNRFYQAQVM